MPAFQSREFDTMVEDTLARIISSDVGITDTSEESTVRAIVSSILAETDIQNYQVEYIYEILDIDNAEGDDLERSVSILGIIRNRATIARNIPIVYRREDPAPHNIPIQAGREVTTRLDVDGNIVRFITSENKILQAGQTEVTIMCEAVVPGYINIPANQVTVMADPVVGISSVTNPNTITGGTNDESDVSLRDRARTALSALGKATDDALYNAIRSINGVQQVLVLDMNRGVGTTDISIVTMALPTPQEIKDEINQKIKENKASGIDVQAVYPSILYIDISIQINSDDLETAKNAILDYINSIKVDGKFIIQQMESRIVLAYDDETFDMTTLLPESNIETTVFEVIRAGSITINGEVVYNEQI